MQVLDRLNPLLEPNGELMLNERGLVEGQVTILKPHKDFRLFLTMDPAKGEISRAMRNRGLEVAFLPDQLTPRDLVWCLSLMGMPTRGLPELVVEQHRAIVAASAGEAGVHITARQLIKWGHVFMALVVRGTHPSEAWVSATELVYAVGGGSWLEKAVGMGKEYAERMKGAVEEDGSTGMRVGGEWSGGGRGAATNREAQALLEVLRGGSKEGVSDAAILLAEGMALGCGNEALSLVQHLNARGGGGLEGVLGQLVKVEAHPVRRRLAILRSELMRGIDEVVGADALEGRPADVRGDPVYTIGVVSKHRKRAVDGGSWDLHEDLMAKHTGMVRYVFDGVAELCASSGPASGGRGISSAIVQGGKGVDEVAAVRGPAMAAVKSLAAALDSWWSDTAVTSGWEGALEIGRALLNFRGSLTGGGGLVDVVVAWRWLVKSCGKGGIIPPDAAVKLRVACKNETGVDLGGECAALMARCDDGMRIAVGGGGGLAGGAGGIRGYASEEAYGKEKGLQDACRSVAVRATTFEHPSRHTKFLHAKNVPSIQQTAKPKYRPRPHPDLLVRRWFEFAWDELMLGDAESACLPFGALILPYAYKKKVAESIAAVRCLRGWEGEEALSLSLAGVPLELEAMKEDAKMMCLGELGAGLIEAVRGLGKNPLGIHKNRVEGWRIPILPAMDQSALLREKVRRFVLNPKP